MTYPSTPGDTVSSPGQNPAQIPKEPVDLAKFRESPEGLALLAWVYEQCELMKSQRLRYARQWTYNLAMYEGKQHVTQMYTGAQARLIVPTAPKYRARSVTNRIEPIIRTEISRMNAQQPSATVSPNSGETEDIYAALAAEQVWESFYVRKKMRQINYDNSFWIALTGNGFVKTVWDNDAVPVGQEVVHPVDRNLRAQAVGDVEYTVVTPFHLYVPDLLEINLEDQPYVFQIYTKSEYWAKRFYGNPDIVPDCHASADIYESTYFNPSANQNAKPDSVLVIEAWIKPGSVESLPDGGMVTVAGKQIVIYHGDGLPYSHGMYPFDHTKHIPTGKFYARSILESLIPLQKEYNRTRSQIIENKNALGSLKLLVPKGALQASKITSAPGEIIEYLPTFGPPTPLPAQSLPTYVLQELEIIIRDMEDISGQHAVSRGGMPGGGVTAATAIGFLQEKDDSIMATVYDSIEAAHEKRARMSLQMVVDFYDLPRLIKVVGTDSAFNALELKGSDIQSGLDIRIEGGSALPTSKQAKQALIMDMMTQGFISPDDGLSILDIGGFSRIVDRLKKDRTEAERENLKFKNLQNEEIMGYMQQIQEQGPDSTSWEPDPGTGMPMAPPSIIPVESWQNHAIHIATHDDYRKGQEFAMLGPEIKALMEQHVQLHKIASAGQMQEQAMGLAPPSNMPLSDQEQTAQGQEMPPEQPQQDPTGGLPQ